MVNEKDASLGQRHWSTIGRELAITSRGLSKARRTDLMKQVSSTLGLAPHTLQRYVVLSGFLFQNGIAGEKASDMAVGPLEVLLRISRIDPAEAAIALRQLREGKLTYRAALAIERRLREAANSTPDRIEAGPHRTDDEIRSLAEAVVLAAAASDGMGASPGSLFEISPLEDERFSIVKVHRLFLAPRRAVAVLDERMLTYGAIAPSFISFLRSVLLAAAVFDHVLVRADHIWDAERFRSLKKHCRPGTMDNIVLTPSAEGGKQDRAENGKIEDETDPAISAAQSSAPPGSTAR